MGNRTRVSALNPTKRRLVLVWARRNWVFLLLFLLALMAGICAYFAMLEPCVETDGSVAGTADVVLALDASNSIVGHEWTAVTDAAYNFIGPFEDATESDETGGLQVGVVKWNGWPSAVASLPLQSDVATNVKPKISEIVQNGKPFTAYGTALAGCAEQGGSMDASTFKLCAIVTDGDPHKEYNTPPRVETVDDEYTAALNWEVYDYCLSRDMPARGIKCRPENVAAQMKSEGWYISVLRVCLDGHCNMPYMKSIISCDDYTLDNFEASCPFFFNAHNFNTLKEDATALASTLASTYVQREYTCFGWPSPWLFLLLLLPCLAYLCMKPLQFWWRRSHVSSKPLLYPKPNYPPPLPPTIETIPDGREEMPTIVDTVSAPPPPPRKYKWDLRYSDKYLRPGSGGGVMHVNYGNNARPPPPSAPLAEQPVRLNEVSTNVEFVEFMNKDQFDSKTELLTAVYGGDQWQADTTKVCCPCCWVDEDEDDFSSSSSGGGAQSHKRPPAAGDERNSVMAVLGNPLVQVPPGAPPFPPSSSWA